MNRMLNNTIVCGKIWHCVHRSLDNVNAFIDVDIRQIVADSVRHNTISIRNTVENPVWNHTREIVTEMNEKQC